MTVEKSSNRALPRGTPRPGRETGSGKHMKFREGGKEFGEIVCPEASPHPSCREQKGIWLREPLRGSGGVAHCSPEWARGEVPVTRGRAAEAGRGWLNDGQRAHGFP